MQDRGAGRPSRPPEIIPYRSRHRPDSGWAVVSTDLERDKPAFKFGRIFPISRTDRSPTDGSARRGTPVAHLSRVTRKHADRPEETMAPKPVRSNDEVLRRVQGEFMEMPGLRLTEAQARRLWGLDEASCVALLGALVDAKFLVPDHTAVRSCAWSTPTPCTRRRTELARSHGGRLEVDGFCSESPAVRLDRNHALSRQPAGETPSPSPRAADLRVAARGQPSRHEIRNAGMHQCKNAPMRMQLHRAFVHSCISCGSSSSRRPIATRFARFSPSLAALPFEFRTLADFPELTAPDETGRTFADNARAKALYYATATGELTVAEDSGLEIDALDGQPGVESARYGGRRRFVSREVRAHLRRAARGGRPRRARRASSARSRSHAPSRILFEAAGTIEGRIASGPAAPAVSATTRSSITRRSGRRSPKRASASRRSATADRRSGCSGRFSIRA